MARGKVDNGEIVIEAGEPPPSTRGGRAPSPELQALVDACNSNPGEWFNVEAGSLSTAASRKTSLTNAGFKSTIRGSKVFARSMTPEERAEDEAARAERSAKRAERKAAKEAEAQTEAA